MVRCYTSVFSIDLWQVSASEKEQKTYYLENNTSIALLRFGKGGAPPMSPIRESSGHDFEIVLLSGCDLNMRIKNELINLTKKR